MNSCDKCSKLTSGKLNKVGIGMFGMTINVCDDCYDSDMGNNERAHNRMVAGGF